jgi:biopolymer transport protein ExbD
MRKIPNISAGSMADIAFLLLVFFLVTTQISEEKGIRTTLPPKEFTQSSEPGQIVDIWLNGHDQVMINEELLESANNSANAIYQLIKGNPARAKVKVKSHVSASYEAYVNVYDAVQQAYNLVYEDEAIRRFGKSFKLLSQSERALIKNDIPLKVSEADLVE